MGGVLRFGFAGAGEIAVASAAAVQASPSAELTAVFDVNASLAADLAGAHRARTVATLDALLAEERVDAVYVCAPHAVHRDTAVRAAEAGKHVFIEKPMGLTVDDARAIVDACERRGVACGVTFVVRWAPAYAKARELVSSGAIGDVTGFRITYRGDKPESYWTGGWSGRATGGWRARWSTAGGGVLLMNAIHDLDALLWITGLEIERAQGAIATTAPPAEVEDVGLAILEATNGALASVEGLAALPGGEPPGARWVNRIHGTDGQIVLPTPWGVEPLALFRRGDDAWRQIEVEAGADARASAFEAYASAVLRGDEPPVPGRDGVRASRLVHAIYDAARSRSAVDIGPPDV
jgi:UDP-N-acetyl-2-amino-2-deoxyglucuronate dehydrogenase